MLTEDEKIMGQKLAATMVQMHESVPAVCSLLDIVDELLQMDEGIVEKHLEKIKVIFCILCIVYLPSVLA